MPIEQQRYEPVEKQNDAEFKDLLAANTVDAFNEVIQDMTKKEISAEIDKAFEEFPSNDLFEK